MSAPKSPPLEEGLIQVCRAIDNQVAREMQRTPGERETHGVLKWQPYQNRVERVTSHLLNAVGEQEIGLDALLVLSLSFSKALQLLTEDLGPDGLGAIRCGYCGEVFEQLETIGLRGRRHLGRTEGVM